MAITSDSTIGGLLEALECLAERQGWPDVEFTLRPDGSCCVMAPDCVPLDAEARENGCEPGAVDGFVEWQSFTCVEELGEFLLEGACDAASAVNWKSRYGQGQG